MEHANCLAPSGMGLSVSEQAGLEIAMLQVRQQENLPLGSLRFWGRIKGSDKGRDADYLIAVATTPEYPFPAKSFYYTTTANAEKMSKMPDLSDDQKMALDVAEIVRSLVESAVRPA